MATKTDTETAHARKLLRKYLKPGKRVYTITRHTAKSGMSRRISAFVVHAGELHDITHLVARVTHYGLSPRGPGLTMNGCGMDMGFALVYELGHAMWPNGTRKAHGTRNGAPDHSGGYALTHERM